MTARAGLLALTTWLSFVSLLPDHAHAGLFGAGNTVQAFYYNGVLANPVGLFPDGASTADPVPLTTSVTFPNGQSLGFQAVVNDTQIVITNLASSFPFCSTLNVGTACGDVINGFDFKFTGENILGVSADASSAAAFLPVTGTFQGNTHQGLRLLSNNEIQVDVTGDLPLLDDPLVLDLTFASPEPPPSTTTRNRRRWLSWVQLLPA